jgi:hypothetical protein
MKSQAPIMYFNNKIVSLSVLVFSGYGVKRWRETSMMMMVSILTSVCRLGAHDALNQSKWEERALSKAKPGGGGRG